MSEYQSVLTEELLGRCQERAPVYDLENKFCQEDFDELKEAGYLKMALPKEFGGQGLSLHEVGLETRKLAYYAAPTALCINMHNYWTGVAATLLGWGDKSLEWTLREIADGEVYAAGHAEKGHDLPILLSTTRAEKVEGGYKYYGQKSFGSLTPVWTRLGIHGMDGSDPEAPKIVHGFLSREAGGFEIKDTWDVMGMRATKSDDTILNGAFVPDSAIARVVPAGPAGADEFILATFAWALLGFANVYCGLARRAIDVALEALPKKTSLALSGPMSHHPAVQHSVAEIVMELDSIEALTEKTTMEWSTGVDHGAAWPAKIVGTKYRAVEGAWKIVDTAMELSGGFGMFKKSELERLFRDARAGRFHPANAALTREFVSKTALGINPADTPRWG